jgi:hypothetical protein
MRRFSVHCRTSTQLIVVMLAALAFGVIQTRRQQVSRRPRASEPLVSAILDRRLSPRPALNSAMTDIGLILGIASMALVVHSFRCSVESLDPGRDRPKGLGPADKAGPLGNRHEGLRPEKARSKPPTFRTQRVAASRSDFSRT